MPQFKYFLSPKKDPVQKNSQIWSIPLPLNRHQASKLSQPETDIFISHGDYFCAAREFLEKNRFEIVTNAVTQHLHRKIKPEERVAAPVCCSAE